MTTHQAGDELDALIATKVMGWTLVKSSMTPRGYPPEHWLTGVGKYRSMLLFTPSTDINNAWLVVETMAVRNYTFNISGPDDMWYAIFQRNDALVNFSNRGKADTAPLAICLASLVAVGEP